jgi:hypothetical protein
MFTNTPQEMQLEVVLLGRNGPVFVQNNLVEGDHRAANGLKRVLRINAKTSNASFTL